MNQNKLIIGCHVSMKAPKYLLGSLNEALSYGANALMVFTGAPQNTSRKPISALFVPQFLEQLQLNQIPIDHVIVHAPYFINLANSIKTNVFQFGVDFLQKEISRCEAIGVKTLVLHPGSSVGAAKQVALDQIVKGLDAACLPGQKLQIALETMSGKGNEVGINFDEIQYIIKHVKYPQLIGVCWDTCHLYAAGYDLINQLDAIIAEFDQKIGLDKLLVLHINDSQKPLNSRKDRHANLGMGHIGFSALINIIYHPLLINKIKILETPWIKKQPPYFHEIKMIHDQTFNQAVFETLLLGKK